MYLLTAVWVIPNSSAVSFCLSPYDCVSSRAMADRIAGITDLTATSQGRFMFCFSPAILLLWTVYKNDICHINVTHDTLMNASFIIR